MIFKGHVWRWLESLGVVTGQQARAVFGDTNEVPPNRFVRAEQPD